MKLNKKTEQLIKLRAAELKKLYETPNPEVDKIISYMNKTKCNCNSPHCKECEDGRFVETGVKTVVEANEHSTDLREKAQHVEKHPTIKEVPGFNKYGQFYGFD